MQGSIPPEKYPTLHFREFTVDFARQRVHTRTETWLPGNKKLLLLIFTYPPSLASYIELSL
jgi:hypothetical protein